MKKCKHCSNNSRLYITEDRYNENVWFARTDVEMFARLERKDGWVIYFYPFNFFQKKKKLAESIELIEYCFIKYWTERYGGQQ